MIATKSGPWMVKPRNCPTGLYIHKRGWCMRINGKLVVICGRFEPKVAYTEFYRRKNQVHSANRTAIAVAEKTSATQVVAPLPVKSLLLVELKDKYLDPTGRRVSETHGSTTTDLYYSNRWQVVEEDQDSLVTAEHVWSPFYVDSMIETATNPQVTTNQSNGSVDTGFGTNSSTNTTTTTLSSTPTFAKAAADGADIVVATVVGTTPKLMFYNASGGLDSYFGSGTGIVSLSWTNWTSITGVVVQGYYGKIDLAVQTAAGGMSVAQLNADGSADTSFGTSGLKTLSSLPAAQGIVLAANGDLLVAGVSSLSFVVAELNPSTGAVDTSYNSSGSTSFAVATSGSSFTFIGMAKAPDGDLILSATYKTGTGFSATTHLALVAMGPAGAADSSFGTSGIATNTLSGPVFFPGMSPLAVNAEGKIFIGDATDYDSFTNIFTGVTTPASVSLNVTAYDGNGSLDTTFGSGGTASV